MTSNININQDLYEINSTDVNQERDISTCDFWKIRIPNCIEKFEKYL